MARDTGHHETRFDLESYVPYLLNRVGTALVARFSLGLTESGLSLPMWRILALLHSRGATRFGVLGSLSLIEPSTLARLLASLGSQGQVSRSQSKVDGRGILIRLTPKGRRTVEALLGWAEETEQYTLDGLSPDEAEFFKRLLIRVCLKVAPSPPVSE